MATVCDLKRRRNCGDATVSGYELMDKRFPEGEAMSIRGGVPGGKGALTEAVSRRTTRGVRSK